MHGFLYFLLFFFFPLNLNMCCDIFVVGRNQPSPQAGLPGPAPAGYSASTVRPVNPTRPRGPGALLVGLSHSCWSYYVGETRQPSRTLVASTLRCRALPSILKLSWCISILKNASLCKGDVLHYDY